jgi:hypothetical protein
MAGGRRPVVGRDDRAAAPFAVKPMIAFVAFTWPALATADRSYVAIGIAGADDRQMSKAVASRRGEGCMRGGYSASVVRLGATPLLLDQTPGIRDVDFHHARHTPSGQLSASPVASIGYSRVRPSSSEREAPSQQQLVPTCSSIREVGHPATRSARHRRALRHHVVRAAWRCTPDPRTRRKPDWLSQ